MKQVKRLLKVVVLFVAICIPQCVKAQEQGSIDNNKVFDVVEQIPKFPDGMGALMSWLSQNIEYPVIAAENGIQGRVIVRFVVGKDGSISQAKVAKSVDPSLDKEAVRVVSNMLNWVPGKQDGQAVNVNYVVPVNFHLHTPYERELAPVAEKTPVVELAVAEKATPAAEAREQRQLSGSSFGSLESSKKYAIQNKDRYSAYDIAYGYEKGGRHGVSAGAGTIPEYYFVQNDDSAMVWYKKCVAYGGDPTTWEKNLYTVNQHVAKLRSEIQKKEKCRSKYTKKYGTSAGTNLFKGRFVGLSLNAVQEFVRDMTTIENLKKDVKYVLQAYQPSVSDVIRYGRGVKTYILFITNADYSFKLTVFNVLNGKVVAQNQNNYGGMEGDIAANNLLLNNYRDEGWIARLNRIKKK